MCISNASFMAPGYKVLQTAELLLLSKKSVILSPTGQKMFRRYHKKKAELKSWTWIFAKEKPSYFHHEWTSLKAVMSSSNETDKIKISLK